MCCKNGCYNRICSNCNQRHRRCSDDNCNSCCRKGECDAVVCSRCVELNIECERSVPLTSNDFRKYNFMRYSVSQFEPCPRTSRTHLQAYFQLSKKMRMVAIKGFLNNKSIHLEMAQGSFEEASNYCKSEYVQRKGTYGELKEENYKLIDGEKMRKRVDDPNVYFEFGIPVHHRSLRNSNNDDDEERLNYINDNASSLTFSEIATNDDIRPRI